MAASVGASRDKRLIGILTKDELKNINKSVIEKIESYIDTRLSDSISSSRSHQETGEKFKKLENEVCEATSKYERSKAKLEATDAMLRELEAQLSLSKSELKRTIDSLKRSESEVEDMKKQRNVVMDERDILKNASERKDRELERLNADVSMLTSQLEQAINQKCEALSQANDVQNREFALNFKEQHIEQERTLLKTQIKGLSEDLTRSNEELQTVRFTLSQKVLDLETQLEEKVNEIKIYKDTNENLSEVNRALQSKTETLTEKLLGYHNLEDDILEKYKREIESKSKLADLYKTLQEESEAKCEEMSKGVTELQRLLNDSVDKYGEMETKYKQLAADNQDIIQKKDSIISAMKQELENANELLQGAKNSCIARVLEKMSPLAGVAGHILHSKMSVTQLYTHLNNVTDELNKEKEENRQLMESFAALRDQVTEKAPLFDELKAKYEQVVENNAAITNQLETIMTENNTMRVDYNEATRMSSHFQRENEKLKRELADLGRQVCYLLKEIQITKHVPETDTSMDVDSSDASRLISKHLVTFSDIQELQANNQKLLKIIRDLNEKQEEREKQKIDFEVKEALEKCQALECRVSELVEELRQQAQMMSSVIKQRDMYRQQCLDGKPGGNLDDTAMEENTNKCTNVSKDKSISGTEGDVEALRNNLAETKSQLDKKMEEFSVYKEESVTNQKILVQQIEDMRKEMNEVTSAYSKTAAQLEFLNEKQNTLQLNISTYKKQIASLEERNHNYNIIISKHENTIKYLRQETMTNQVKLSKAEVQVQSLQREVAHLKNVEIRLSTERDLLVKEKQGQSLLMTNLELIKASLERSEAENCVKLETKLDEANAEISAMRRSLQEEQERFRELTVHLEKETEYAKDRMEEEKTKAVKLKQELDSLREELKNKTEYIEEISKKFSSAINPTRGDGTFDSVKKVKELESILETKKSEIISLQNELEDSKQRIKQFCAISEEAESQVKTLTSQLEDLKKTFDQKINSLTESENKLKERCSELETELSLQSEGTKTAAGCKTDLAKLIERLKILQNELKEKNALVEEVRAESLRLSQSVQKVEEKYAHEMILHSNDIQVLTQTKEKLAALQQNISELQNTRDEAINNLNQNKQAWDKQEQAFNKEKEELQARFNDLNNQNSLLLDQVQALSTKLSMSNISKQSGLNESANISLTADTSLNKSMDEDEIKSSEKLVQIIKFLRKERDIIVAKFEIIQAENARIKSEFDVTEKKLEEAKSALSLEKQKLEANAVAFTKNSEILRKVETLDAITDSNRILREERDSLLQKVNMLTESTAKLEETLIPLQESSKENSNKLNYLQSENSALKSEVARWRTRVNALVEKANKTSPEDWKRLQNERETLAKMLTTEKENVRRLNEEANNIRAEKLKYEEQINNLNKQHAVQTEEIKKQTEELSTLKKDLAKMSQELGEIKTTLNDKINEGNNLNESLKEKEAALNDLRNKETQIRKIAKKYKAQFEELSKTVEDDKSKRDQEAAESAVVNESQIEANKELEKKITDLEKSNVEKISELEAKITSALEENNKLKKENESLKEISNDKEEKAKQLLKQAKTKIVNLTDNNEKLTNQLNEVKSNIETAAQNKEENDTRFELLTSQYETRINRAEKEKNESIAEKQQEIQRLRLEIEGLNVRISQLIRERGRESERVVSVSETGATPTANIKPMAAHSATMQGSVGSRRGETPFASIRPMASTATRTAAVLPSPSSSGHSTEYMPASSSARPRPTAPDSPPHPPQALVSPRVEEGPGPVSAPPRPSLKRKPQHSHKTSQQMKRSKTVQQGQVSESHCETEYQVPTSSQRDHEDDGGVVLVDSEEDPDDDHNYQDTYQEQMYEDGEAEADDDGDDEEIVEGGEAGVAGGVVEGGGESRSVEAGEGEGEAIPAVGGRQEGAERQGGEDTSQELPAQSECEVGGSSEVTPPVSLAPPTSSTTTTPPLHTESVSSGTQGEGGLVVERVSTVQGVYEESGDDGIVPSTPTLYVPRRSDGFGEAVSSPVGAGRFTFTSGSAGVIEDTHADLTSQLSEGGVSGSGEGQGGREGGTEEVREGEEGREAEASSGGGGDRRTTPTHQQQTSQQHTRPLPIVWGGHGGVRGGHQHHRGGARGRRPQRRTYMRY